MASGKGGSHARQAVKNNRRKIRRNGKVPRWMRNQPLLKMGAGGTDRGGKNAGKAPRFSDEPATGPHGKAFRKK